MFNEVTGTEVTGTGSVTHAKEGSHGTTVSLFVFDLLFGILDSKGEITWSLRNRLVK